MIPFAFAKAHGVAVTAMDARGAQVAVREDARPGGIAELRRTLGVPIRAQRISTAAFDALVSALYSEANAFSDDLARDADFTRLLQDIPEVEDLLDADDDAPVIRLINALFMQALRDGASDIHIEPYETRSVVRLRIDGTLRDLFEPARALHAALVSRVKIMAQLDIAEKRLPQDGRITVRLAGKPVDVRVSTIPTGHGERAVLRLLDKQAARLDLAHLGMDEATLSLIDQLVRQPHGIVLMTGPTGSGKTTTLYAALSRLDAGALNIMTVEDPIEYDLDGISQTSINSRIDMSFARALRAILRQDPDVVMIGEIRDLETAEIAVQASLTGHLVLATLHTNDAISAVTRLADMGVEPFLLASSLIGVGAQRLVRKLCPECRTVIPANAESVIPGKAQYVIPAKAQPVIPAKAQSVIPAKAGIHFDVMQRYSPAGCPACLHTGYRGRTGIYELVAVDDGLRRMIHDRAPEHALRAHAAAQGMRDLREDGMRWVAAGVTSLEEVLRVTRV